MKNLPDFLVAVAVLIALAFVGYVVARIAVYVWVGS